MNKISDSINSMLSKIGLGGESRDNNGFMTLAFAAAAMTTTTLCGIYSYHFYLCNQRHGEAKITWSWIPVLGDAIEFGQQPVTLARKKSKNSGEILGLLLAGDRIFFINDPASYGMIFKVDKHKVGFHTWFFT
jgi:hypothetical protein